MIKEKFVREKMVKGLNDLSVSLKDLAELLKMGMAINDMQWFCRIC